MKKILSVVLSLFLMFGTTVSAFAYDSLSAESDLLKTNDGKPVNLTIDSGANWTVPNAGVTVIRGNNSQEHVNLSDGVSGTISVDSPDINVSKTNWLVKDYGAYDTFSVSGTAPINVSTEPKTYTYKVNLTCTSSNDLSGLNKQTSDFFIINLTVNPSTPAPVEPGSPVIADTTAPVITLAGSTDLTVEAGTTYVDEGATAIDNVDGDITKNIITVNPVDTFKLGVYLVTYDVTDSSGNKAAQITRTVTVVDTTAPEITAPANIEVVLSGALTQVNIGNAVATDLFLKDVTSDAPADGFKVGTTIVTWTATDTSGNKASATQEITVKYAFSGILQPINTDGSSIFKAGSTVPVKFYLTDSNGAFVSTARAALTYAKITDSVMGTVNEAISTSASTTGNAFKYDSVANQYIFNMNTKGLTAGTYQLTIQLDDGKSYTVKLSLK